MITIKNIRKSFNAFEVLKGINLNVKKQCIYGFIGINGAGKSTLIKCLMNFLKPDNGEMYINNNKVNEYNHYRNMIGYLPEVFQPPLDLKCKEFLAYCYSLITKENASLETIHNTLKLVGLEKSIENTSRKLSKGMRQRLGLAQAIIHSPSLLILDEPFSGLDPIGRFELKQMLLKLNKDGKTIFFSSHNLTEIQDLCSHIGILHNGIIQEEGTVSNILTKNNSNNLEQLFLKIVSKDSKE